MYDVDKNLVFPDISDQLKNSLWKYKHNKTTSTVIKIPLINLLESGIAQVISFVAKRNCAI